MKRKRTAAFFDFDRTLLMVESARLGIRYLREKGEVPATFVARALFRSLFYRVHLYSDVRFVRFLLTYYQGRPIRPFKEGAEDFYHRWMKPRLAPGILDRVKWHRDLDHVLVLISGSLRYLLEPVARDLGFDHLICTTLERDENGVLTGCPAGPVCMESNKKLLAEELALWEDLDMAESFAYGNHQSDLPLLLSVGHPVAVEPTRPLMKEARKRGWPVLDFDGTDFGALEREGILPS